MILPNVMIQQRNPYKGHLDTLDTPWYTCKIMHEAESDQCWTDSCGHTKPSNSVMPFCLINPQGGWGVKLGICATIYSDVESDLDLQLFSHVPGRSLRMVSNIVVIFNMFQRGNRINGMDLVLQPCQWVAWLLLITIYVIIYVFNVF